MIPPWTLASARIGAIKKQEETLTVAHELTPSMTTLVEDSAGIQTVERRV